ncbi:hypothetical protein JNUCC64_13295 [Streptomyces sp. JNUCC 64]
MARYGRRATIVALAATATALLTVGPPRSPSATDGTAASTGERTRHSSTNEGRTETDWVRAPVRIADPEAARLLEPGDRVDVVTADSAEAGVRGRVVANGVRVADLPETTDGTAEGGALVLLSAPRGTAARLAGASVSSRLAVVLRR